jgi:RNA polymerase sigma-70 factor (ECF subfamily)
MMSTAIVARSRQVPPADEDVIAEVLAGRTACFEVLMRRYNARVYRAARAIVRDEREAEEVMQQAYVNAYVHLRQFDGRARFSTWLTRIVVNEALAHRRRRDRFVAFDAGAPPAREATVTASTAPDPERQAFGSELGALIESAIDRLPAGVREVFMLRQVEGMSTAEVAAVLDVTEDVVRTRFSRARAALRRDLTLQAGASLPGAFAFLGVRCDRVVAAVMRRITPAGP